jgi:lysozyme family protein
LAKSGDPRIRYIISNGQIFTPTVSSSWRTYSGSNPHDHHAHVSVSESPSLFDSTTNWQWEAGMKAMPGDRPVTPQITDPVLRKGSKGDDVRRLQTLLGIKVDGDFGPATEKAVKAFQSARGLGADGVVGLYTWRALKAAPKIVVTSSLVSPKEIIPLSVFDQVIEYVIDDEGDELNLSPNEPGGASKFGISLDTLSKFIGHKATLQDLRALSEDAAKQIYRRLYWDAIKGDTLPIGLNYAAFDFAVNSGVATVDGVGMDDYLTRALREPNLEKQINRLCDLRLERMRANPDWPKYKNGWSARVARVRSRALSLAGIYTKIAA